MRRSDTTRTVSRQDAHRYFAKAKEFSASASSDLDAARWNAAGLNAIHAGISATDAAIVAASGLRSAAKDHGATVELLAKSVPAAGATQIRQLTGLLGMKNTVEYEQRLLTEAEARSLAEQSTRLVRWAGSAVIAALGER
jgi:hypothetical protein